MKAKDLMTTRDGMATDRPFIYSSWLLSLWGGNEWFRHIDKNLFFNKYHDVIEALLNRPKTKVSIACLIEDPQIILGYSVRENAVLHYVFVKKDWREVGIAHELVKDFQTVSHLTKIGLGYFKSHKRKPPFNPFI